MTAEIFQIGDDSTGCNSYILQLGTSMVLIDTSLPSYAEVLLKRVKRHMEERESELDAIVLTHEHIDHSGGAWLIQKELGASIFAHPSAKKVLTQGDELFIGSWLFGEKFYPPREVFALNEGHVNIFDGSPIHVLHTPGHSPGSLVLYVEELGALFSGDLLFTFGSVGRWDLPGGDLENLCISLKSLTSLEFNSLYPGHGAPDPHGGQKHLELALKYMSGLC